MKLAAALARQEVLIIEDDQAAGDIFEHVLRGHGYAPLRAGDAETALHRLDGSVPSAILLDLRLPTIDGLELLRRIRSRTSLAAVPVVVITGDYLVDDEILQQLGQLGARIRFKPLWEEDLVQIVTETVPLPLES